MRRNEKETSDIQVIEDIIRKADVCRMALANGNIPYIVTMNFGYTGGISPSIFFHCAKEGKKLDMIRKNNCVCFEIDTDHQLYSGKKSCNWGMRYKSVIGYGNVTVLTEREAKIGGLNCIMTHYGGKGEYSYNDDLFERTLILRLDITEMTGKIG